MNRREYFLSLTVFLAGLLAAQSMAAAEPWRAKVDPWVLDTASSGETEFLVFLAEQADLSGAVRLEGKPAKGAFVFAALTAVAERTQGPVVDELKARGVEFQPYWVANMLWVRGGLDTVRAMAERGDVLHVYANPAVRLQEPVSSPAADPSGPRAVEWNIALVNAPQVWATGVTGVGTVVAGQDTGYMWNHPALVNKYRGGPGGSHDYNWHDAIHSGGGACGANSAVPCDDYGHGTHTMGTMVGDDGAGNQVGMAPGAKWIGCRNMDGGVGTPATYAECYQWFIAPTTVAGTNPDPSKAPDVINNSWGCPVSEGCTDPNVLLAVVQSVRAAGIVTVHSAGNDGSSCSSVNTPAATYAESLSVGATDSTDTITYFSSRGPVTVDGSNRMKPNVSAPGDNIRSSTYDGGYQGGWSGTSMAGPHVAGLVALVISGAPGLAGNVDTIEMIVEQTSVPHTTSEGCGGDTSTEVPNNTYGWGRVDALAAHNFPLDFTLAAAPSTRTVCAPANALFDLTIGQYQSFTEPVTLSVTGLPPGAAAGYSTNPVTPPGTSTLTISGTGGLSPGSYPMSVDGTSAPSAIVHSAPVTVVVSTQAAGGVSLTAPANGALNQPSRPAFAWTASTQAATYDLQVAADAGFVTVLLDRSGITATSYTPDTDLATNSVFYWRVRGSNGCGVGPWAAAFTFTTLAMPGDCGLGTVPLVAFSDGFESGAGGWTHMPTPGTSYSVDTWALQGTQVHGGAFAFHADDWDTYSDQALVSPSVTLPATGSPLTLQFWNSQDLETSYGGCYDGGVVEISTNGGSTWTYLPTGVMLTDPYDGPVSGLPTNPNGWCGRPQDWLKSVVDINAYAGQTVKLRFRLGTDVSVGYAGWAIDDVTVQSCAPNLQPIFGDGFETGTTAAWSQVAP